MVLYKHTCAQIEILHPVCLCLPAPMRCMAALADDERCAAARQYSLKLLYIKDLHDYYYYVKI
jgi:hypothetical protein